MSFNREKFHPLGGPDGGDGGRGGDVYIQADAGVKDLSYFRHVRVFKGEDGKPGGKQKKHGRDGKALILPVPAGTSVIVLGTKKSDMLADLVYHGQKVMVVHGGRGGLGNVHYATATNQAPRKAGRGEDGSEASLLLEFKSNIEICILGGPNSGKSTLLERMTSARPKVADYPFTTLDVLLGQMEIEGKASTIAEIPALIYGSSEGKGLGNKFLRHCLRAKALLLMLDSTSDDILRDLEILRAELNSFSSEFELKPRIVAVNKADLPQFQQKEQKIRQELSKQGYSVFFISAGTGSGIPELLDVLESLLKTVEPVRTGVEIVFRPKPLTRRRPE